MTPHTDAPTTLAAKTAYETAVAEWRKIQQRRHFIQHAQYEAIVEPAMAYIAALERQLADAQARERAAVYVTLTPEAQARYAYDKDEELLIVASWIEGNYYYTVEGRSGRNIATSSDLRLAVYCPQPQENSHE